MPESLILKFFLCFAFVLAPLMTNAFFLANSRAYAVAHVISVTAVLASFVLNWNFLAAAWPLFCGFGFLLFLNRERAKILSLQVVAGGIPFLFSLISSLWFFSGANNLRLLGYDELWSFYAALHGSYLGWLFVGCMAHLSRRPGSGKAYAWGSCLCFALFLCVAVGINGIPILKRFGAIGLALALPFFIGLYMCRLPDEDKASRRFAALSLAAIAVSMSLALLNEFGTALPILTAEIPTMVLTHGALNALVAVPCFFLAIKRENSNYWKIREAKLPLS